MDKAPCHRSKNRAFINPDAAPPNAIRAAIRICEGCPLRIACAASALTAGTTLDGSRKAPVTGVIQAGIVCRGDLTTAWELSIIADRPIPDYQATVTRRVINDHCTHCNKPMVSWTRDKVPSGHVMHYSRGYCTNCRKAYRAAMEKASTEPQRQGGLTGRGLRKVVDRKRHTTLHSTPRARRDDASQLSLFDGAALLSAGD